MNTSTDRFRAPLLRTALVGLAAALTLTLSVGPADAGARGNDRAQGHAKGHAAVPATAHSGKGHGSSKHWTKNDRRRCAAIGYGAAYRFEPAPRYRAVRRAPVRFVVPARIATPYTYAEYRYGQVYHAAHGHWHDVYRFPLYGSLGVTWKPYDYCNGNVHATGTFAFGGPRFGVRIGF